MKLKGLMWVFILFTGSLHAMDVDDRHEGNTDETGGLISVETLPALAKKYVLPAALKANLKAWFQREAYQVPIADSDKKVVIQNKDIVARLASFPALLSEFKKEGAKKRALLKRLQDEQGIKVHQSLNYIFQPTPECVVRVAGLANRLYTYISGQELASGKWFDPYSQDGDHMIKNEPQLLDELKPVTTYHTLSMFTNYLLLRKYINKHGLKHVVTPDTYLMHIPDTPAAARDDHYCLVQKVVQDTLLPLDKDAQLWSKVSDQALKDLFIAAKVGLWNIEGNLTINEAGQFVLLDLEQPNNSDPRAFFNKKMVEERAVWGDIRGSRAWARYVVDGLGLIKNILVQAQAKCVDPQTKEVKDQALWDTLESKRLLWLELMRQNPTFVKEYSEDQQNRMNALAKD
jgi:hypothetical protein